MLKETIQRVKSPTPKFFKKLIRIGIAIGVAGAAILAAPVTLPAVVVTAGGYMVTVGSVVAAVSKLTKDDSIIKEK